MIRVIIAILIYSSAFSQSNYKFLKTSNNSVVLIIDNEAVDTLSTYGLKNKHTYIKIKDNKVFMSNYLVPGVSSLSNSYVNIGIWGVENGQFKGNSIKVYFNNYSSKKIRFYYLNDEILCKYRISFFRKKIIRTITISELKSLKSIKLQCSQE